MNIYRSEIIVFSSTLFSFPYFRNKINFLITFLPVTFIFSFSLTPSLNRFSDCWNASPRVSFSRLIYCSTMGILSILFLKYMFQWYFVHHLAVSVLAVSVIYFEGLLVTIFWMSFCVPHIACLKLANVSTLFLNVEVSKKLSSGTKFAQFLI